MEFTKDMQLLNEIVGTENTMKIIASLGGINLYVPKPDYNVIMYYHEKSGADAKRTAQKLGVSERTVYRAIQAAKEVKGQFSLLDELFKEQTEQQTA